MKRLAYLCALVWLALPLASPAQGPRSVLPDSFGSWRAAATTGGWSSESLDSVAKEAGETLRAGRVYNSGNKTVTVRVIELRDASGAYEIYTAMLSTQLNPSTV